MNSRTTSLLLLVLALGLATRSIHAQNIAGYWLGVTTPTDPNFEVFNYTMTLTQANAAISGTAQTSNPNVPFGGSVNVSGSLSNSVFTFGESDKNGSTAVKNICFWRGKLTYNPTDESLVGTYENITNGVTCTLAAGGKVELFRIVLKSGDKYCKGKPVNLVVTGKNIRWYSASPPSKLLATGNTYSPQITQTTTFYITQTLYKNESPAIPITVTVDEPVLKAKSTNSGCDKGSYAGNGSIDLTAPTAADWRYSLNDGPFQTSPTFTGLAPGSYTVVAKDTEGCQATQIATVTADTGPQITDLKTTPPHCETANGEVVVVTLGGKAPMTYSVDYGRSFQPSPVFTNLAGGIYTFRVRDTNGCEVNRAVDIPKANPVIIQSTSVTPTSCGQANGQVNLTASGGKSPIQYSIDTQTFQAAGVFMALQAGNYNLQARDSEGCTTTQSVSVAASLGLLMPVISTTPEGCGLTNGAIAIAEKRSAGVSPLLYSLAGSPYATTDHFSGMKAGNYSLSIKDDRNCIVTQDIQIALDCANLIHLPTAFSPNQDNRNDELKIYFVFSSLRISRFTVYDRWGTVIHNRANFVLASGDPLWNGLLDGQPVPVGTYIYRLECQFPDGAQKTYRESVVLLN